MTISSGLKAALADVAAYAPPFDADKFPPDRLLSASISSVLTPSNFWLFFSFVFCFMGTTGVMSSAVVLRDLTCSDCVF